MSSKKRKVIDLIEDDASESESKPIDLIDEDEPEFESREDRLDSVEDDIEKGKEQERVENIEEFTKAEVKDEHSKSKTNDERLENVGNSLETDKKDDCLETVEVTSETENNDDASSIKDKNERLENMEKHLQNMIDLMEELMSKAMGCPTKSRGLIKALGNELKKLDKANVPSNEVHDDDLSSDEETDIESISNPLDKNWELKYRELRDYRIEKGNCDVPQKYSENPQLGRWVTTQRVKKKGGNLAQEKIDKLDRLYFNWGKNMPTTPSWSEMYQRLVSYWKEHENCKVPFNRTKPSALAKWMAHQRMEYKRWKKGRDSLLLPAQIRKLDEIDFDWKGPKM